MNRSNETWLEDLKSRGPRQEAALADLRHALLRGLRGALPRPPAIDEVFLEDIVQDTLMRILERLEQFQGRSRFITWALTIAVHAAMGELRRRRWKDVSLDEVISDARLVPERAVDRSPGPAALSARREILEIMHRVIRGELTEKQRTALMAELGGMPLDEIARHVGSNRNAIYKLTHDARRRLKKGLEAAGFGAAEIGSAFAG